VRDIEEVLREKERAIEQLRREIEALYSVTPLLDGGKSSNPQAEWRSEMNIETASDLGDALRTAAPLLMDDADEFDPGVRARLVEAGESECNRGRGRSLSRHLRHIAAPLLGRRGDRTRDGSIFS
jgi:hypothetical protein